MEVYNFLNRITELGYEFISGCELTEKQKLENQQREMELRNFLKDLDEFEEKSRLSVLVCN